MRLLANPSHLAWPTFWKPACCTPASHPCTGQALEEAIERGLERVEAGAQGEHKIQRGYLPRLTYSSHYICSPALRERIQGSLRR